MSDLAASRLNQARESLEEARALLAEGMDMGFVMNALYYAFFYPVLAVLNEGRVPQSMQSVTIALFDRQFILTGIFKKEHGNAIRRVAELRPKCSGLQEVLSRDEAGRIAAQAREFITDVETYLSKK